jgi:hypothetical protein
MSVDRYIVAALLLLAVGLPLERAASAENTTTGAASQRLSVVVVVAG